MGESFIQLPADGVGKKLRTFERTVGANTVQTQFIQIEEERCWWVWVPPQVAAANKIFLAMLNTAAQKIALRGLWIVKDAAAVTGAAMTWELKRISAITGGTAVTPNIMDTADSALTGVTCVHTPTSATEGVVLFGFYSVSEEQSFAAGANMGPALYTALTNLIPVVAGIRTPRFNQNEGFALKQTVGAVGSFGVLAAVTLES